LGDRLLTASSVFESIPVLCISAPGKEKLASLTVELKYC
jgi:hypothetical protein